MRRNLKVAVAVGAMAVTMMISTACQGGEKKPDPKETGSVPAQSAAIDGKMMQKESIKDYFDQLSFLTEEERQQLLKEEEESKPFWEKLRSIHSQMESIEEGIKEKYASLYEKQQALMMRNEKIWMKLASYGTPEAMSKDHEQAIQEATDLSEEEKKMLLKDVEELKTLDSELEKANKEIEDATAKLREEAMEYEKKLIEISEQNRAIWNKIHDNNINLEGYRGDVMLY